MNQGDANSQAVGGVLQFKKRRRSTRKRKSLTVKDVKRIAANQIRGTLEHKHWDLSQNFNAGSATYPLQAAGLIIDMTGIIQGLQDSQRIGDQITYTSWQYRVIAYSPDTTAQNTGFFLRVIGFLWREATTPIVADVLQSGNLAISELISSYQHHSKPVRKILFDKTVTLFDRSIVGTSGAIGHRVTENSWIEKFYVNLTTTLKKSDRVVSYDPVAGVAGYNKLYVCMLSNINGQALAWPISTFSTILYIDG